MLNVTPASNDFYKQRGIALFRRGRFEEAASEFGRAAALAPRDVSAWDMLGLTLARLARFREAAEAFGQAARLADDPIVLGNLGAALLNDGRPGEAVAPLERSVTRDPAATAPRHTLAMALAKLGRTTEALVHLDRLVGNPACGEARATRGMALSAAGRSREAVAELQRAMASVPSRQAHDHLLMAMHEAEENPAEILATARRVNQFNPRGMVAVPPPVRRGGRLRVGYLSGDFCDHPVAQFFEPLLRHHDASRVEVFCYSTTRREDVVAVRLRQACANWRDLSRLTPEAAAGVIGADQIDVLVELGGHMPGNPLAIVALRPITVCASYIGYPSTTGMAAVGFRITDGLIDPPGAEAFYSETLVRLEGPFVTYAPPGDVALANEPPSVRRGYCTFGSAASRGKISVGLLASWVKILQRVPGSRLRVAVVNPTEEAAALMPVFERGGIAAERVTLVPRLSPTEYLESHNGCDILLDSFPLSGHTTICNALWMGVPTVCLRGAIAWQRLGASVLSHVGWERGIAASAEEYVETAVGLAQDRAALGELRGNLRDRLRRSRQMDHAAHAREVERALRVIAGAG